MDDVTTSNFVAVVSIQMGKRTFGEVTIGANNFGARSCSNESRVLVGELTAVVENGLEDRSVDIRRKIEEKV